MTIHKIITIILYSKPNVSKKGGLLSPHWENSVRAFQQIMIKSLSKTKKVKNDR